MFHSEMSTKNIQTLRGCILVILEPSQLSKMKFCKNLYFQGFRYSRIGHFGLICDRFGLTVNALVKISSRPASAAWRPPCCAGAASETVDRLPKHTGQAAKQKNTENKLNKRSENMQTHDKNSTHNEAAKTSRNHHFWSQMAPNIHPGSLFHTSWRSGGHFRGQKVPQERAKSDHKRLATNFQEF